METEKIKLYKGTYKEKDFHGFSSAEPTLYVLAKTPKEALQKLEKGFEDFVEKEKAKNKFEFNRFSTYEFREIELITNDLVV